MRNESAVYMKNIFFFTVMLFHRRYVFDHKKVSKTVESNFNDVLIFDWRPSTSICTDFCQLRGSSLLCCPEIFMLKYHLFSLPLSCRVQKIISIR